LPFVFVVVGVHQFQIFSLAFCDMVSVYLCMTLKVDNFWYKPCYSAKRLGGT
jgi:hypothetical protein